MDGEFDNFTYVHQHNMSEIDKMTSAQAGNNMKAQTEFNQSFCGDDDFEDQAGISAAML